MAEQLKTVGYATGIIRQWHLGYPQNSEDDHPQNHGFNEFVGYDRGNIDFVSPVGDHLPHNWWHGRVNPPEEGDATDLINRYAVEFIDRHYDRPFCRYVPHLAIHNRGQVRDDPAQRAEQAWKRRRPANDQERIENFAACCGRSTKGLGKSSKRCQGTGSTTPPDAFPRGHPPPANPVS